MSKSKTKKSSSEIPLESPHPSASASAPSHPRSRPTSPHSNSNAPIGAPSGGFGPLSPQGSTSPKLPSPQRTSSLPPGLSPSPSPSPSPSGYPMAQSPNNGYSSPPLGSPPLFPLASTAAGGHVNSQGYFLPTTLDDDSLGYPLDLNFDSSMAGRSLSITGPQHHLHHHTRSSSSSQQNHNHNHHNHNHNTSANQGHHHHLQNPMYYPPGGFPPSPHHVHVVGSIRQAPQEDYSEMLGFADLPALVFVGKVSPSLVCPIHKGIFVDPLLVIICGHTFCRKCIESAILPNSNPRCPVDNKTMSEKDTVPNLAISDQISDLPILCRFGCKTFNGQLVHDPEGCQETIKFGQRESHERACLYAIVECPNSAQCDKLQRRALGAHLESCRRTPCVNKDSGCKFEGTKRDVERHLSQCHHKGASSRHGKEVITETSTSEEIALLRRVVDDLSDKVKTLEDQLVMSRQTTSALAQEVERERASTNKILDFMQEQLKGRNRKGLPNPQVWKIKNTIRGFPNELEMPFVFNCAGTFLTPEEQVWCLHYANNYLVSGGSRGSLKFWDLNARRCVKSIAAHQGIVYCLGTVGGLFYSGGEDCMIRSWRIDTFEESQTVKAGDDPVSSLVTTDRYVITGSLAMIKVWNCLNLKCEHVLTGLAHWVWVRALALDEKKTRLFSGTHNALQIWDLSTFQCLTTVNTYFGSIYSIVLTPKYLVCGTYNQNIHLYEMTGPETYEHIQVLTGHIGTIRALVPSVSGRYLFSGSVDNTVMIWNLEAPYSSAPLCIQTLYRHSEPVNCLAYKNGSLFSGSSDHTIMIFETL